MKKYSLTLFIFRRDLRLVDNTALIEALKKSKQVIPCFIFDPEQITSKNKYKSNNALQFMLESLEDLKNQLKKKSCHLYFFYGKPHKVVEDIVKYKKIDAIFVNRDYTPYSLKRDEYLDKTCRELFLDFNQYQDLMLHDLNTVSTRSGKPYTVFTPFLKSAIQIPVRAPKSNNHKNYYKEKLIPEYNLQNVIKEFNRDIFVHGGRVNALKLLKNLDGFKHYQETRDYPTFPTTGLSAHNKFGTLSAREEFYAIKEKFGITHQLIRQIFWRDFYTQIAAHFPRVYGNNFLEKYNNLPWKENSESFKRWCTGKTGFPIIDAGMRQLNATGWMHNRVRMIVASFLTKDLHLDWRLGEKYFAQQLVDYDPAVNNGNWQWAASTGCDAQPYFRIFNPWLQQAKFDPECSYIKRWVPELISYSPKIIHTLFRENIEVPGYPKPIVDHNKEIVYAKNMFLKHGN